MYTLSIRRLASIRPARRRRAESHMLTHMSSTFASSHFLPQVAVGEDDAESVPDADLQGR